MASPSQPVCVQCGMSLGRAPGFFGVPNLCNLCALSWTADEVPSFADVDSFACADEVVTGDVDLASL